MLIGFDSIRGATIRATDGTIGEVDDVYFDDATWHIRYLVVDTGGWLSGRRVLLAPTALGRPDPDQGELPVALTREQVERSPDIDTAKPVSREMEERLYRYYGWAPYWGEGVLPLNVPRRAGPGGTVTESETANPRVAVGASETSHLRSIAQVTNYYIRAADGDIGHVEEFLIDDADWTIRYMVVDTRNWLPGKKVLVSPQWIEDISWSEETVRIDLTRQQVKDSPEYDPSQPPARAYEERLFGFYGRVPYWE